ncbi:hypothetical protein ACS0TY_010407 [Phlomoides rotata]
MECNKDEATRAKSIAVAKIEQKDYIGAKKFASKAQSLYPGLDGISQMLTTLEVYASAEKKNRGEVDWYSVLGVNPSADDETIKRQYRRLALLVHPDKNTSIGAEGAFKLISEAWSFLSDKAKRLEYNKRRAKMGGPSVPSRPSQPNVSIYTGGPSAPSRSSEHKGPGPSSPSNCASRETSVPKPQDRSAKAARKRTPVPSQQPIYTFWTTCSQCAAQFEYLRIFQNCTLLCYRCEKPFTASETVPPPAKFVKPAKLLRRRSTINN